jgi:hypothetical protein
MRPNSARKALQAEQRNDAEGTDPQRRVEQHTRGVNRLLIRTLLAVAVAAALFAPTADAKKKTLIDAAVRAYEDHHSYEVPAAGTVEVAFSSNEGSEALVVKMIDSARSELRLLSYSFTSAPGHASSDPCPSSRRGREARRRPEEQPPAKTAAASCEPRSARC